MKNQFLRKLLILVVAFLPLIYLGSIWKSIPHTVALHFNATMEADRIGDKIDLLFPCSLITVVSVLLFFLFEKLHLVDPKRKDKPASANFRKLSVGLVVFMSILNIIIIQAAVKGVNGGKF